MYNLECRPHTIFSSEFEYVEPARADFVVLVFPFTQKLDSCLSAVGYHSAVREGRPYAEITVLRKFCQRVVTREFEQCLRGQLHFKGKPVLVMTWDHGIRLFKKPSIQLAKLLSKSLVLATMKHDSFELSLPPLFVNLETSRQVRSVITKPYTRTLWMYFRGTFHLEYPLYSHGLRQRLCREPVPPGCLVGPSTADPTQYWMELAQSAFCLCPSGWAPWSPRFLDAIQMGCIPIVYDADHAPLPVLGLAWDGVALVVPRNQSLQAIYERITALSAAQRQRLQTNGRQVLDLVLPNARVSQLLQHQLRSW